MRESCAFNSAQRWSGLALFASLLTSGLDAQTVHTLDTRAVAAWASLLRTHDTRVADTVSVDAALASRVTALRAAGTRVVGLNRIVARYAVLRGMLRTERDTAVASDAAFALGLATDSTSCGALRDALRRPGVGTASAWALGELGARCGDFAALLGTVYAPTVRASLLRVAVKWIPFPDSAVAGAYRSATSTTERWAALYACARSRRSACASFALSASHNANAGLRDLGARLLATALQPPSDTSRNVARLDSMLRDSDAHTRISAVRSMASYGRVAEVPLTRAWPLERDENVRVTMAQSIGSVATDSSMLWSEWWEDTTHMVRRSLIVSAWQRGAVAKLQVAFGVSLATHPDYRIRLAMIEGAAARNPDEQLSALMPRLDDSDSRVRDAAMSAISRATPAARAAIGFDSSVAQRRADSLARVASLDTMARPATAGPAPTTPEFYERIVRAVILPSLAGHPPELLIATTRGTVRIVLDGVRAPMTADHLSRLARADYFRNLRFHRVVPAFVAQGGDPGGDGSGGPGYAIRDELNRSGYLRGAVGMALSGPDTGGSQFFLTLAPQPHLDGHYTVFGTVVAGFAAMDALTQGATILNISPVPR